MTAAEPLDHRLFFEASPDLLLVLRPDAPRFSIVTATDAYLAATQTLRERIVGRGLFEVFPDNPDDPSATGTANLRASLERVLATGAPDTMAVQKYDITTPDGGFEVRHWSPKNLPILGAGGEVRFILHRVEDVTDLVRAGEVGRELRDRTDAMEREVLRRSRELDAANRRLREANAKLGELDAAKTVFFGNVSHELRTPLTLMLGPLEDALEAEDEPLPAAHRVRVELAHTGALRLLKLVNALLHFSRVEAGRMKARFCPIDLSAATSELAAMFQSAFDRVGLRLSIDCPPLAPVHVDRDMWDKIVPNLVSNAFKFTMTGGVTVRLRDEGARVALEVSDTGVGIPEGELARVFERFHRVPVTASRTHEGTGIGLALVRQLVELHGGTVSVTSVVGRGTTFRVELLRGHAHLPPEQVAHEPAAASATLGPSAHAMEAERWARATDAPEPIVLPHAASSDGASAAPRGPRARILVVDDNADLRHYLATLLGAAHEVTTAVDGLAALEALEAGAFDMVVSDVMMPRLDGVGLVRALRADPSKATLPVLLLSARAGEGSTIEGLDAGADDYLVKPFAARELLARVRTHVELARLRRAWTLELERANRELDGFAYSVSHDLRAPLRAIDGFTRMIVEDVGDALPAASREHLERVVRAAGRMGLLIDALLDLARVARASIEARDVDLSSLAEGVLRELRAAQPDRVVDCDVAPGLAVRGDPTLLEAVLQNLLGNAWKYTQKRARARIEVGRVPADEPTFFVRDDGAGFDMANAHRLFTPFQRFHRATEFPGTGIGLATVQRIVARHHGRIWAEAEVDRGATFYFTVPAHERLRA